MKTKSKTRSEIQAEIDALASVEYLTQTNSGTFGAAEAAPMTLFAITRTTGEVIATQQAADLRSAIVDLVRRSANLLSANLGGADLGGADLGGADLLSANLSSADLRSANLRFANLRFANLRSADLRSADLRSANLRFANLRFADLRSADLRSANLRFADIGFANFGGADLRSANLRFANLSSADLRFANLSGANGFERARLAWESHDLLAEILRRAAGDEIEKNKVAGFVLISREKCWRQFAELRDPLTDWALDTLAEWVQDGDGAPDCVRKRKSVVT